MRVPLSVLGLWIMVGLAAAPSVARAQAPTAADLFAQAEAAFAKDHAVACPLYEQALGAADALPWKSAFLATTKLALCKREAGKLATAAALYRKAAEIIRQNSGGGRDYAKREAEAEKVAQELSQQVSTLTVIVPSAARLDGLVVRVNGEELEPARWNQTSEVDGGEYVVRAEAPGHEAFETTLTIAGEQDREQLEIPVLSEVVAPPPEPEPDQVVPAEPQPLPALPATTRRSHLPAFIAAGAGGALLLGAGAMELWARAAYGDYKDDPAHPMGLLDTANQRRDVSNVLLVGGAVGLAAGAALWFLWPAEHAPAARTSLAPVITPEVRGVAALVRF